MKKVNNKNVLIKQDGYSFKRGNSFVKHETKKISGSRDGWHFECYSSTTSINYSDTDFDQNLDMGYHDFFEGNNILSNHYIDTTIDEDDYYLTHRPKIGDKYKK